MKPTLAESILQITATLILAAGIAATGIMMYGAFTPIDAEGYRQEIDLIQVVVSVVPALSGLFLWALANVVIDIHNKLK